MMPDRRPHPDPSRHGSNITCQSASPSLSAMMSSTSNDAAPLAHIEKLVAEEHALYAKGALDEAEQQRLSDIQVELDRCWDLLRQRRALRETGRDPAEAHLRPPDVVEKYSG